MYFQEIKMALTDLEQLLAKDGNAIPTYMEHYIARKFYVGDTGINRKTLKDWESNGLLPYDYKDDGWRKFSFLEWVWLECIMEFRQLGVSLDKIKEIKEQLFDINAEEAFSFIKQQLLAYEGEIDQKEMILAAYDHPDLTVEMKKQLIQDIQLSPFLIYLLLLVNKEPNLCLVYNNNKYCSFFVMGVGEEDIRKANEEVIQNMINDSFVVLNLRKIVNNIFQKPELRHHDDFILDFLSPREKVILDQIRSTNAKEILITFDKESNPTHIKVNRNRISKETLNKVARYLKKGNYQTVEFTTRDGQLIKYEETDTIKLDT